MWIKFIAGFILKLSKKVIVEKVVSSKITYVFLLISKNIGEFPKKFLNFSSFLEIIKYLQYLQYFYLSI